MNEVVHDVTYYEVPALKKPVWKADIPTYFYVGGAAGAAAALGAAASLCSGRRPSKLAKRARNIAMIGGAVSAALLIRDLGRPARFGAMLRVFRPSSPMNLGTWVVTGFSGATAASWVAGETRALAVIEKPAYAMAGLLGLFVSGYTAVLISNTAVPVWQGGRRSLPVLFISASAASAGALLECTDLDAHEQTAARRFGLVGKIVELGSTFVFEREVGRTPRALRALQSGTARALWLIARTTTAASLALSITAPKSRTRRIASGVLTSLGSLALRFAVHEAGKASAVDPRATFHQQQLGLGAAEVTGHAAVTSADYQRAIAAD